MSDSLQTKAVARNGGVDALRGCVALLVVLHHTAIIYGARGGWYYHELAPSGSFGSLALTFFCTLNQAWFMGLFFLLAGYYTPPASARRGLVPFARERLVRLGLPVLAYAAILHPITAAETQASRGNSFGWALLSMWRNGRLEFGPMWFAFALLIFTGVFLLVRMVRAPKAVAFPSDAAMLVAAVVTGAIAFLLRLEWPVGATVFGLQLGYFASYGVLFAAGCAAADSRLIERIPLDRARLWRRIAFLVVPTLPVVALAAPDAQFDGGWSLPALLYAMWEPLVAWGLILTLLLTFQRRFAAPGAVVTRLGRRAFAIYVVHPPILTGAALLWRAVDAPALVKFAVTGAVACLACYLAAGLLLRIPAVARVL